MDVKLTSCKRKIIYKDSFEIPGKQKPEKLTTKKI